MPKQHLQLTLLTAALWVAPMAAGAAVDGKRIVAMPMDVEGALPDHARADIDARIRDALGHGGNIDVTDPVASDEATTCVGTACLEEIAAAAEATHVLRTIVKVDGRDYEIELVVSDGATGMTVATAADTCDTCGLAEVGSVVTDIANAVRRKLEAEVTPPPTLVVRSKPAGAMVLLDGEPIGTTPLEATVPAGEHDITIEKRGFIVARQRAAFVDGVRESVSVNLERTAGAEDTGPGGPRPGRALRIVGWTTAGLGLGAVGAGIALIVIDGKEITSDCSGDSVDLDGDCRWRYGTLTGGAVAAGVGGAALVTGITLAVIGHKRGRQRAAASARVRPTATGLALRF